MRWPFRSRDRVIDGLIKPPVYSFRGHDETLAVAATERRQRAERMRSEARRLDTRDDARSRLRRA